RREPASRAGPDGGGVGGDMAKEPENITPVILREIRAKQDDLAERFGRVEARLGNVEKQLSSLAKVVTYSLGQSTETQLRQIEPGRAAAAQKKYMQALQNGGSISIDPADLKGIVSLKGKPSKAAVRQLLARVQKIFESCNI